jgi:hypothetical protein
LVLKTAFISAADKIPSTSSLCERQMIEGISN